jgi:hypothetical protein
MRSSTVESGTRFALYRDTYGAVVRHEIVAELRPVQGQLTTTHAPVPGGSLELSICGEEYHATRSGARDARYREGWSYGQNLDDMQGRRALLGSDLSNAEMGKVWTLWHRFHLSGMSGTCAHQTREAWTCTLTGERVAASAGTPYTCTACGRHRWDCERPCFEVPGSHAYAEVPAVGPQPVPNRRVKLACACGEPKSAPVHGYRAGSGWLVEILDPEILASIRALFRIPEPGIPVHAEPGSLAGRILGLPDPEPCDECGGTRWPREEHDPECSLHDAFDDRPQGG